MTALKRNVEGYFEENKPYTGLGRASLHGGMIFVTARGLNIFVQLASTILLARLLSPQDFGLVAMVLALVGFAPLLIDFGTTDASVQKTHIAQDEISTVFWLNLAIGVALTVLLAGTSGLIARVFGEPALTNISLVLSLTFIMAAVSTQHYALMRRAMQFRRIAIIDISANVIGSAVSIVMALTDWGYWALVAKPIVTSGLSAAGVWLSCPWVPGRPRFTPAVKELVRFGMGVTGFTMTDYVAKSADRLVIGYFYGAGPLGYFQNAFNIYSNLLSILTEPLHNIAVSGLSKLRNNVEELKRSWTAALSTLSFFSAGDILRARGHGAGFRDYFAGAEMGSCRRAAVHFRRQGHCPQRRTHARLDSRRRRARRSLDAVGPLQCRLPAYRTVGRPTFRRHRHRHRICGRHVRIVRTGFGVRRTAGRDWQQGRIASRRAADDRGTCHRRNRISWRNMHFWPITPTC